MAGTIQAEVVKTGSENTARSTELVVVQQSSQALATADFMPVFDLRTAKARRDQMVEFTKSIMIADVDFGTPGGIAGKPSLLKPGAEKLVTFFGMTPQFETVECVEDWTGKDHGGETFFYYRYKCRLFRQGRILGEGEGSCNTWESRYRYRWVNEEFAKANNYDISKLLKRGGVRSEFEWAIEKGETAGKYGKPTEYWQTFKDAIAAGTARKIKRPQGKNKDPKDAWEIESWDYRIPNPDVSDQVNTCLKMAQKRALVAVVLITTNASEFFTQDIEDMETVDLPRSPVANTPTNANDDEGAFGPPPPFPDEPQPRREKQQSAGAPAEEKKPWANFGEMKYVFEQIEQEYQKQECTEVYRGILSDFNVKHPSQFTNAQKAAACYKSLVANLRGDKAA